MFKTYKNTFGDNLKDNIESSPQIIKSNRTSSSYNAITPSENFKIDYKFRLKFKSEFFNSSVFCIWKESGVSPSQFYWERLDNKDATPALYKYGPFFSALAAMKDIEELYGISTTTINEVL